ncbi:MULTISPECIES: hypothetical protein [Bacteroides]|jgi:hypothetical protein|nr:MULTISPECIES: hypothetical protein [Bacteroides]MBS6563484.1 hypothetical protein [Staphylococcus sp.]RHL06619.1 hypothetical protein DW036_16660 [Bacteroides sp. AF39-11AC]
MNYFEPNVVIVDDKLDEIQGIITYYQKNGIGCKYYNADLSDGDDYPENEMSDVTFLFLDLFYSDHFDVELSTSWVRSIIQPGAFYVLILWTKDISKKSVIEERLKEMNLMPYSLIIKNKGDYAINSSMKYDYTNLLVSIDQELKKISAIEEILIWKNALKQAANIVLGGLISERTQEFTDKLKKVIESHGGKSISNASEPMLKRSTLFEALNNVLLSNIPQFDANFEISDENKKGLYDLSSITSNTIDRKLNSWFHFSLRSDLEGKTLPGIIAKNKSSLLKQLYSITDDEIVRELISPQVSSAGTIIEDIVLNITRPCDYSQNKYGKNLKLLSGIIIRHPLRKNNEKRDIKLNDKKYKCILKFDHLYHNDIDDDLTLIFDLRYCFSIPVSIYKKSFDNKKMLNRELLSDIQVTYGNYVSQLGYTKII